jgi:hypothetical protein
MRRNGIYLEFLLHLTFLAANHASHLLDGTLFAGLQ